ncbi:hypothetical protein [Hypericibacter adhaerens]|uniref:hypothetical protein n=1 Tax=Hypericibacter adhaerens TaxID=2602016 RepID=UPI00177C7CAE|nr:hypothetical protein [Hypericibacter adhaerens]
MAVFLAGCATEPPKNPVPIQAAAYQTEPQGDYATVVVIRDGGYGGSFCYVNFYVDSQLIANFDVSQMITIYVPPGEHIFSIRPVSSFSCGDTSGLMQEIAVNLKNGETKKYRIGFINMVFTIAPTAF